MEMGTVLERKRRNQTERDMKRIPFDSKLFFAAMCGRLGRRPDHIHGLYFVYYPKNEEEERLFRDETIIIREFLDHFKVLFSGTGVDYFVGAGGENEKLALCISITPQPKKQDGISKS